MLSLWPKPWIWSVFKMHALFVFVILFLKSENEMIMRVLRYTQLVHYFPVKRYSIRARNGYQFTFR